MTDMKINQIGYLKKMLEFPGRNQSDRVLLCPSTLDECHDFYDLILKTSLNFDYHRDIPKSEFIETYDYRELERAHPLIDIFRNHVLVKFKKYTFRVHPSIKWKKCKTSNKSLYDDLKNCGLVIYRRSSVCLDAIQMGVKPLYFESKDGKNYDCLFRLKEFKESFRTPEEFEEIKSRPADLLTTEEQKKALDYVKGYRGKICIEALN